VEELYGRTKTAASPLCQTDGTDTHTNTMSSSYFSYTAPPMASTPWFEPSQNPWTPRSPGFPHQHNMPLLSPRADASHMQSPAQPPTQRPSASSHQPSSARPRHDSASAATATESTKVASSRSLSFTLPTLCCSRCRRENGHASMFQFGKNLYYCSHCARMVGYVG
jgi:hypothetical protein